MSVDFQRNLADAELLVNDEHIAYVPGSLKKSGEGEMKVRAMAAGNNAKTIVAGNDVESELDEIKFDLPTTSANIRRTKEWKAQSKSATGTGNTIRLSWDDGRVVESYASMYMTNKIEREHKSDGNIPCEFSGTQVR